MRYWSYEELVRLCEISESRTISEVREISVLTEIPKKTVLERVRFEVNSSGSFRLAVMKKAVKPGVPQRGKSACLTFYCYFTTPPSPLL